MKLQIYGSGCAKCQQLTANAEAAATQLGLSYELEKITDLNAIIHAGVMRTPAWRWMATSWSRAKCRTAKS